MPSIHVWYVRRKDEIKGPYPAGIITRHILLGRIRENDEVSAEGSLWTLVSEHPELIPDVMKEARGGDAAAQQRLEAARRWADERNRERRSELDERLPEPGDEQRQRSDRRTPEIVEVLDYRMSRTARAPAQASPPRSRRAVVGIVATVGVVLAAMALLSHPPPPAIPVNCHSAPTPGINWSNCMLEGARLVGAHLDGATLYSAKLTGADLRGVRLAGGDLSYATLSLANLENADFTGANLTGVDLRRAHLAHARFVRADLSYADLAGAELAGVDFSETKLGNAIWPGGAVCAPESVGTCLPRR